MKIIRSENQNGWITKKGAKPREYVRYDFVTERDKPGEDAHLTTVLGGAIDQFLLPLALDGGSFSLRSGLPRA